MAAPAAQAHNYGWQDLLTNNVIACGVAAIALLVFSLMLRGLLKLTSLTLVVVLVLGAFWFLREAIEHRTELLPHDWVVLAEETLHSAKAKAAWHSVEAEVSHHFSENRITAGVEDSRRLLLAKLQAKAAELRKRGHKSDAEQLVRLRDSVEAWKRE